MVERRPTKLGAFSCIKQFGVVRYMWFNSGEKATMQTMQRDQRWAQVRIITPHDLAARHPTVSRKILADPDKVAEEIATILRYAPREVGVQHDVPALTTNAPRVTLVVDVTGVIPHRAFKERACQLFAWLKKRVGDPYVAVRLCDPVADQYICGSAVDASQAKVVETLV